MRNIKSESGAITILVLVSVLFMLSFLISSYVIIANKVQAQKEIIAQTKSIYENYNLEDIYNSYFGKNIIPITDKEQLLSIGTGNDKIIDGNYYDFANNKETVYLLMNDIEFTAYTEETLKDENGNYYWTPIGERTDLLAGFEGNNNKIRVKYRDDENEEYTVEYSNKESYSEPEYKVKVIPRVMNEDGEVLSSAKILSAIGEEEFKEVGTGEMELSIKRLEATKVKSISESYKDSGIETIYIKNPNKIKEYNLVLGKYAFTIMPTPSNATVTINGENRTTISVNKGEEVSWKVEATGYDAKSGTYVVQDDSTMNVSLDRTICTFTIIPTPADAIVIINGENRSSINVEYGTMVTYSVAREGYHPQEGSKTITDNSTIPISLTKIVYVPFSKTGYITVVSNGSYTGLFNGGEVKINHSVSYDGTNIDMGNFTIQTRNFDIPSDATISKVTVYYSYKQSRASAQLYTNRVRISIYAGKTEKMAEYGTDPVSNSYVTLKHELTNITRQELDQNIIIHLRSYYRGSLSSTAYIKNVYCVVEGTYPT